VGALLAPQVAALGALAALVTRCTLTVEREEPGPPDSGAATGNELPPVGSQSEQENGSEEKLDAPPLPAGARPFQPTSRASGLMCLARAVRVRERRRPLLAKSHAARSVLADWE
jgi:hypothetical protein